MRFHGRRLPAAPEVVSPGCRYRAVEAFPEQFEWLRATNWPTIN